MALSQEELRQVVDAVLAEIGPPVPSAQTVGGSHITEVVVRSGHPLDVQRLSAGAAPSPTWCPGSAPMFAATAFCPGSAPTVGGTSSALLVSQRADSLLGEVVKEVSQRGLDLEYHVRDLKQSLETLLERQLETLRSTESPAPEAEPDKP